MDVIKKIKFNIYIYIFENIKKKNTKKWVFN